MALDLANFHQAFFDESFEALDTMEASLLKLNIGAPSAELINTIFRVAHSIKGGSATFGFSEVASFTHTCETLLDELRSNRMQVTQTVIDLLLKSVDVMREMLRSVQQKSPMDAQRVADLQFDLEVAILQKGSAAPTVAAPAPTSAQSATVVVAPAPAAVPAAGMHRWRIVFRPFPSLFVHGNDPARMLRELADLGSLTVNVDVADLPAFVDINPEACFLAWTITLESDASRQALQHVFDWAEGDCELEIVDEAQPSTPVASVAQTLPSSASVIPAAVAPASAANSATISPAPAATVSVDNKFEHAPAAQQQHGQQAEHEAPKLTAPDASSIRVSTEKIDELMNTVGELVITQSMLSQLGAQVSGPVADQLRSGLAQLERNMRELQESVMRVRMLPISFVFSRFPRMVRDLSQRLGKHVDLKVTGEQTELDKTVLEKIGDPLVHLVRNSVDHGIELPEVRMAAGKPAVGTVYLEAYHKGGNIAVEVGDDGAGLDKERILAKARAQGLIGANDTLTDEAIYELIFVAGFSTAQQTTDISGRGVGMDVVRRNIKELGGTIEVRSEAGRGSRFVITLPLTLAIVDGQSVAVGSETYIVPLITIIESLQLKQGMMNRVAGRSEVFKFRDTYLPVIRLHEIFGVKSRAQDLHEGLIMVVEGDGKRVGLFVDDLLGQQQVVIKSLEANFRRVDGVSGATILGDGSVALILDVPGLIHIASRRMAA